MSSPLRFTHTVTERFLRYVVIDTQSDPASPNYRHWLSPEEYADRFGVSQADLDKIVAWLENQQLTIGNVAACTGWA